jgi:hypothetical protein
VRSAFAALLLLGVLAAPVHAESGGLEIHLPDGGISFEELAPGYGGSAEVRVTNGSEHDAELVLQAVDVSDDENTCVRQEVRDGDVTCDDGGGELSAWLQVQVVRDGVIAWKGPMTELMQSVLITEDLAAGAEVPFEVSVELPVSAGNDTMTDRVEFGLRWTASADTGDTETDVLGVEGFAPGIGGAGGAGVPLPFTGATADLWLLVFGGVLVSGGALLLGSRRLSRVPAHAPGHRARPPIRSGVWPWGIQAPLSAAAPTHRGRR